MSEYRTGKENNSVNQNQNVFTDTMVSAIVLGFNGKILLVEDGVELWSVKPCHIFKKKSVEKNPYLVARWVTSMKFSTSVDFI